MSVISIIKKSCMRIFSVWNRIMSTAVASSLGFNYDAPLSKSEPLVMADYISEIAYPMLDVELMLLEQRGAREVSGASCFWNFF